MEVDLRFNRSYIVFFVLTLTLMSLLDVIYNKAGFDKGAVFSTVWIILILILIYSSSKFLISFYFSNKYFEIVFWLFFAYGIVVVLRGWSFAPRDLISFLRVPYIFWPFLIPLFVFFIKDIRVFFHLMYCLYFLGVFFLIVLVVDPSIGLERATAEPFILYLCFGSGFLWMNSKYLDRKIVNINFVVILVSILSLIYLARRAGLGLQLGFLIFGYGLSLFWRIRPMIFRLLPALSILLIFVFILFGNISSSFTHRIDERILQDSRSGVVELFYMDMQGSLLFGKGINGTYFCPIGGTVEQDDMVYTEVYYRDTIENGYLQLVLSGGWVHVVLFLLVLIPAAFNGIFRASNNLVRSSALIILLWLIYMFGFGQPSLSIGYVLVWICVGICYHEDIRGLSDEQIVKQFATEKPKFVFNS